MKGHDRLPHERTRHIKEEGLYMSAHSRIVARLVISIALIRTFFSTRLFFCFYTNQIKCFECELIIFLTTGERWDGKCADFF